MGRSPMGNVSQEPYYHVLHDIQDRNHYILGGCCKAARDLAQICTDFGTKNVLIFR